MISNLQDHVLVIPDERDAMLGKKIIQFGNDLFRFFLRLCV